MRILGHSLLVLIVALAIVGATAAVLGLPRPEVPVAEQTRQAQRLLFHAPGRDDQIAFRLTRGTNRVRILVRAVLPRNASGAGQREREFALEIATTGPDGSALKRWMQYYRAAPVRSEIVGPVSSVLNLTTVPMAEVVHVRLVDADPDVRAIEVAALAPDTAAADSVAATWQRLSPPERRDLAGGNVYPMELLTEREKAAIVSRLWQQVLPSGVEGKDYRAATVSYENTGRAGLSVVRTDTQAEREHQASPTEIARAFLIESGTDLEFVVHHRIVAATVLRLDLWRRLRESRTAGRNTATVTYAALDVDGRVLERGDLRVDGDGSALLSRQTRQVLTLSSEAVRLRLSADQPIYVAASNRLQEPTETMANDATAPPAASTEWFSLLPEGSGLLIRSGRTIAVVRSAGPAAGVVDRGP